VSYSKSNWGKAWANPRAVGWGLASDIPRRVGAFSEMEGRKGWFK
jgi:hypothetical protein